MLAVVLLAGCSATGADEPTRAGNQAGYVGAEKSVTIIPPDERKPAPDITGAVLGQDGKEISTADLTGKVVVLNVWGSWCGPCRAEAPALQKASEQTEGVAQFIGLNTRDFDQGPPVAFNRSNKITYPSIWDPTGSVLVSLSGNPAAQGDPVHLDHRQAGQGGGPGRRDGHRDDAGGHDQRRRRRQVTGSVDAGSDVIMERV